MCWKSRIITAVTWWLYNHISIEDAPHPLYTIQSTITSHYAPLIFQHNVMRVVRIVEPPWVPKPIFQYPSLRTLSFTVTFTSWQDYTNSSSIFPSMSLLTFALFLVHRPAASFLRALLTSVALPRLVPFLDLLANAYLAKPLAAFGKTFVVCGQVGQHKNSPKIRKFIP